MTTPAAFQGDFVDLRFIKGRKVCQIVIEIPIEAGTSFVSAFGTPDPSKTVPVAIARLDPNAKPERKGGKLCQRAALLCREGAFQKFMSAGDLEVTVDRLRNHCGVESRSELDHDEAAARKFLNLEADYKAWLTVA